MGMKKVAVVEICRKSVGVKIAHSSVLEINGRGVTVSLEVDLLVDMR